MIKIYLSSIKEKQIIEGKEYLFLIPSNKIYEGKGYQFLFDDDMDKQLAVFRRQGKLYCLSNICPHRHQDKIYDGIIDDMKISCPEHGWTYSLETGQNVNPLQGLRSLRKYVIIEKEGKIYIEYPEFDIPKWRENI